MRSWLGVEYWPAKVDYQIIYILHYIGLAWNFAHWVMDGAQLWHLGEKRIPGVFGTQLMEPGEIIGDWFHSLIQNKQVFMVIVMMN